jgi:hypothetical protein
MGEADGCGGHSPIYSEQAKRALGTRQGRAESSRPLLGRGKSITGRRGGRMGDSLCAVSSPHPICSLPQARPPIRGAAADMILAAFNLSSSLAGWTALSSVQERGKCCPTTPNFVLLLPHCWLPLHRIGWIQVYLSSCRPLTCSLLVRCFFKSVLVLVHPPSKHRVVVYARVKSKRMRVHLWAPMIHIYIRQGGCFIHTMQRYSTRSSLV